MTSSLAGQPKHSLSLALALALDQLDDVPGVDAAGDELRTGSAHRAERLFALVVDERDVAEVHNAFARITPMVRLLPTGFEFHNPRRDEAALQNPALLSGAVGDRDPQHCVSSRRSRSAHAMPMCGEGVLAPETLSGMRDRRSGAKISARGAKAQLPLLRHLC